MSRKRLGLLVPSSNTVMEVDFYRGLPANITLHAARILLEETTVEAEKRMIEEHTPVAARDLSTLHPDLVVFGCTSASAVYGVDGDARLQARLTDITGAPTIGVMSSVLRALDVIEAERVAVITPYIDALNAKIADRLTQHGLNVVAIYGLGVSVNFDIAQVRPDQIVAFARQKLANVSTDCVFVSCTNFRAVEALPELTVVFDVPVITSNKATLDAALTLVGQPS